MFLDLQKIVLIYMMSDAEMLILLGTGVLQQVVIAKLV